MRFTYTLTFEDYEASILLHTRQKVSRRISFEVFYRVIPVMAGITTLIAIAFLHAGNRHWFQHLLPPAAGLLWLAIFFPIYRFFNVRRCFKRLFGPNQSDRNCIIDFDDERILSILPGRSEGKIFWTGICAFAENEKVMLFYLTEVRFLPIPVSAIPVADRPQLQSLINRNLARK